MTNTTGHMDQNGPVVMGVHANKTFETPLLALVVFMCHNKSG